MIKNTKKWSKTPKKLFKTLHLLQTRIKKNDKMPNATEIIIKINKIFYSIKK